MGADSVLIAFNSYAYFYIRYSANADGSNMTSTPQANTKYMGTCSSTSATAPTNASAYSWSLIKGEDGEQGIKGEDGANGESSYLHVKYSNDGRTFTPNNGEDLGSWIGTYVDNNPMDSSVFSDYNWSKFVGEDGQDGQDGASAKFVIMNGKIGHVEVGRHKTKVVRYKLCHSRNVYILLEIFIFFVSVLM